MDAADEDGCSATVYLTRTELARALGVSLPTIDNWAADEFEGGMPCHEEGSNGRPYKYDLDQVRAWRGRRSGEREAEKEQKEALIRRQQDTLDLQGGSADGVDLLSSEARSKYYESELKRMKTDQMRGTLVLADEFEAELGAVFKMMAQWLQSLPDHLQREAGLDTGMTALVQEKTDAFQESLAREMMERGRLDDVA